MLEGEEMNNRYNALLEKIDLEILKMIKSENEELTKIVTNYFSNKGKKIRPLLTLICSSLGKNADCDEIIKIASIIEIIHTTTLIHDDIIDKAKTRRGKITLNMEYGNEKALYIGDYLFSRVLYNVSYFDNSTLHEELAKTLKELCIGELIQNDDLYNINTRRLDYLKKIKRKTAILIAFSCLCGALISNSKRDTIITVYKFGYYLGMSYQIIDDLLDFVSSKEKIGKNIGQDLINGNITLPIILKIEKEKDSYENLKNKDVSEKLILIEKIKSDDEVIETVKNISNRYLKKAEQEISNIDEDVKKELQKIINKLHERLK